MYVVQDPQFIMNCYISDPNPAHFYVFKVYRIICSKIDLDLSLGPLLHLFPVGGFIALIIYVLVQKNYEWSAIMDLLHLR